LIGSIIMPGTPAIQNAIPMPFFGTTPFAAPGLGIIASVIMLAFGLWWLGRAENEARSSGRRSRTRLRQQPQSMCRQQLSRCS
jgi:H+/gluconate symporter-like permease